MGLTRGREAITTHLAASDAALSSPGRASTTPETPTTPDSTASPDLLDAASTLAAVDRRIDALLGELETDWHELAGRQADILGDLDLPALLEHAAQGGKRLRPEIVHWGWVAAGAPGERRDQVVDLGAAVEMLHVFALVHDDVMDRSLLRRGRDTVHVLAQRSHRQADGRGDGVLFGDSIAILAGDLLLSEADRLVSDMPASVRAAWRRMMHQLVLGQRRDLTGAAAGRRDLPHALEVARLKSGSYTVEGPLVMGALLGGASEHLVDALRDYAGHVGEAFGLRDDVLGVWGDPKRTGKSVDDDLGAGKATVLLALAAERLSDAGRWRLERAGTDALDPADLDLLRVEMDACGVREQAEQIIRREVDAALACLDPALLGPGAVSGLGGVAERLAWRQQ